MHNHEDHEAAELFLFAEDRHLRVYACENVWDKGADVLNVFHDEDGDWQFLCGGDHDDDEAAERIRILCLDHIPARDASINSVSKLPRGGFAVRSSKGEPWFIRSDEARYNGLAAADPMPFVEHVRQSADWLRRRQDAMNDRFDIRHSKTWHYDQDTALFTFTFEDRPTVRADFQSIGSFSTRTSTWLWSWANESVDEHITQDARRVRELGLERHWAPLWLDGWQADEVDGWEMAAIGARLSNAEGCYRAVHDGIQKYDVLRNFRHID